MPTVDVFNLDREVTGQIELSDAIFGVPVKTHVLHEVVIYQLAKRRAGTAKTKGRSEVRGGGRKPWRQKGSGRARAGTSRSPSGAEAGPFMVLSPGITKCVYQKR